MTYVGIQTLYFSSARHLVELAHSNRLAWAIPSLEGAGIAWWRRASQGFYSCFEEERMTLPIGRRLAAVAALASGCFFTSAAAQNIDFGKIEVQTVKVADGLYVLMGGAAQGNIVVSTGSDGILLIDSMY